MIALLNAYVDKRPRYVGADESEVAATHSTGGKKPVCLATTTEMYSEDSGSKPGCKYPMGADACTKKSQKQASTARALLKFVDRQKAAAGCT